MLTIRNAFGRIASKVHQDLPGMLGLEDEEEVRRYGGLPKSLRQGEINPQMQGLMTVGVISALLAVGGVIAFTVIAFTGAPVLTTLFVNAWFAGSVIELAGLAYGIVNDIIGCHRFLPYFSLGHQPDQRGLIESNDPNAVGIAWGIMATTVLSSLAGIVFAGATLVTGFMGLPFAGFVLPVIALLLPAVIYCAHKYSLEKEDERRENGSVARLKDLILFNTDDYQSSRLTHWIKCDRDANRWLSNSDRNSYGFTYMPLVALVGLAALVTLSAVSYYLPAVLFTTAVSVFPAVGLGLLLAVGVMGACCYLYKNHNTKVDNIYDLDYPEPTQVLENTDNEVTNDNTFVHTHSLVNNMMGEDPAYVVSPEEDGSLSYTTHGNNLHELLGNMPDAARANNIRELLGDISDEDVEPRGGCRIM